MRIAVWPGRLCVARAKAHSGCRASKQSTSARLHVTASPRLRLCAPRVKVKQRERATVKRQQARMPAAQSVRRAARDACVFSIYSEGFLVQQCAAAALVHHADYSLLMRLDCFHSSRACWKTFIVGWLNSWLWMQ